MEQKTLADYTYQQFLNNNKLMGSRCQKCGSLFLPPRAICTNCGSTQMEWVEMKGKGKLVSFTSITVGTPAMIKEGFDRKHPYCVGIIQLDEGVKIDARLDGIDATRPETLKIGLPLTVKFLHQGTGEECKTTLLFSPL